MEILKIVSRLEQIDKRELYIAQQILEHRVLALIYLMRYEMLEQTFLSILVWLVLKVLPKMLIAESVLVLVYFHIYIYNFSQVSRKETLFSLLTLQILI